jgi:hypothetical protein
MERTPVAMAHLAVASRDLLPCSASEVDLERLFSACRDEYGIIRHSLKAEAVRVLVLLRSAYQTEDDIDKELIKVAMTHDIVPQKNSILWHLDSFNGRLREGMFIIELKGVELEGCLQSVIKISCFNFLLLVGLQGFNYLGQQYVIRKLLYRGLNPR